VSTFARTFEIYWLMLFQTDPKRDDIDRAINALETGLSEAGYQKA